MDRIISMIINAVLRQFINRGVNAGIDHVARRGKPANLMTPDERKQAADAKQTAKRARQAANLARRLGR
jgi:hypothetical protein